MQAAPRSMWRRALSAYHMVLQSHAACQCLPSAHLYMSTSRIQNSESCCRTGAEAHQQAAMLALGYCHPDNLPPLFEEMPALIEDYSSVKTNVGACTGVLHQAVARAPRKQQENLTCCVAANWQNCANPPLHETAAKRCMRRCLPSVNSKTTISHACTSHLT